MEAFLYGLSIFLGLVSGVVVTLCVDLIKEKIGFKKEVENLRFEVQCNIAKLEKWLKDVEDLMNKINSDRVMEFSGYFNLSLTIYSTSIRMFQSGSLYRCLSKENIEKLQEVGNYLTIAGENLLNSQINAFKQSAMNGCFDKTSASRYVDTWRTALLKCEANYEAILKELQGKK